MVYQPKAFSPVELDAMIPTFVRPSRSIGSS
jgi:hypothetical protein